jgi:hypothetical protein
LKKERLGNCQADRLCSLHVDDKLILVGH